MNDLNYYEILNLPRNGKTESGEDISLESIISSYYKLKFGNNNKVSFDMYKNIDEAYDVLSNNEKRQEYNKKLQQSLSQESKDEIAPDDLDYKKEVQKDLIEINDEIEETTKSTIGIDEKDRLFEDLKFNPTKKIEIYDYDSIKKVEPIKEKEENPKKTLSVILGSTLGFSVVTIFNPAIGLTSFAGTVAIGMFVNSSVKKRLLRSKLTKQAYTGIIKEVKTEESKLMDIYYEKLKDSIDKLISKETTNFVLEKYKLKYENEVELLKNIIKVRKSIKKKNGELTNRDLRLLALIFQLIKSERHLRHINESLERKELLKDLKDEELNSFIVKNLVLGNKYLQFKNLKRKVKLQGGLVIATKNKILSVKDLIIDKIKDKSK